MDHLKLIQYKDLTDNELYSLIAEIVNEMTDEEIYGYYQKHITDLETDQFFREKDYKSMREILSDYYILWELETEDLHQIVESYITYLHL